jgi:serpin B
MNARIFHLILIILLAVGCTKRGEEKKAVTKASNQFAFDLYGRLKSEKGSIFLSPLSVSTALAITLGGARGETEKELAEVLHLGSSHGEVHRKFSELLSQLRFKDNNVEITIANALWAQSKYKFLPDYLSLAKDTYGAGLNEVDFTGHADAARQAINHWVNEATNGKIKELIGAGAFDDFTHLVLTNVIYFKGKWAAQFKTTSTKNQPFHISSAESVDVPMMAQIHEFRYGAVDDIQVLELPYVNDNLAMLILLPKEIDGLTSIEGKLNSANLDKWTSALREQETLVYLPKFTMVSQFNLNDVLTSMGMKAAFDVNKADFSGMNGDTDLYLSAVVHKAFVEVNEEGTEAAAATGFTTEAKSDVSSSTFRADHPFVFLIRDKNTRCILFMGRLVHPSMSSN